MPSPTRPQTAERVRAGRLLAELPEPFTEPVVLAEEVCRLGGRHVLPCIEGLVAEEPIYHVVRSDTRCDVGRWLSRPYLWVLAGERDLFVGAWGSAGRPGCCPREYRVTFADLTGYAYEDVVGASVVKTHHDHHAEVPALRMSPLDGYQLLAQIEKGPTGHG